MVHQKHFLFFLLLIINVNLAAQYEVKHPLLALGVSSAAVFTYAFGGIPNAPLFPSASPHWGGSFRPEHRHWNKSAYLFAGVQTGLLGVVALSTSKYQWKDATLITAKTISISYLLSQSSKAFFPRLRPYALQGAESADDNRSFWSGTSAMSMSLAGLTWQFADAYMTKNKEYVKAGSLLMGGFIMYSRVKAGHHHVSDVLVGGAVGFALGYFLPTFHAMEITPTGFLWRF